MSSALSAARCNGSQRRNAEMTLGRTSANKIKIKTDGEAGLRAVSCGCCNCLFDAFSPTPTPIEGAQKFKYLTYESSALRFGQLGLWA